MTKSDGTPVKPQQGGGGDKGRKYETGRGGLRIPNPFKDMDADKWAAMAEATGELADAAGERAKATKSTLDVKSTKVRSNNKSAYNYYPKRMSAEEKENTSPLVTYDADYEKEKKRLGLS